jgi:hypothetical protein
MMAGRCLGPSDGLPAGLVSWPNDHESIRQAAGLTDEQRQAWLDVFHCWLMIRLLLKLEEIRKMNFEDLLRNGLVSEAAFRDLTARAEHELQQYRANLQRVEHRSA